MLPAKLPLLLMLGAEGIAVGLSTRILPHNFGELLKAQMDILQKKKFTLIPDFPQGGLIDAREYDEGRGRVRCRAIIEDVYKRQTEPAPRPACHSRPEQSWPWNEPAADS